MAKSLAECLQKIKNRVLSVKNKGKTCLVGITDPAIATYASFNEFGWVQSVTPKQQVYLSAHGAGEYTPKVGNALVNPPRPFMHATFLANAKKWQKAAKNAKKVLGIADPEQMLSLIGQKAVNDIQDTIKNAGNEIMSFAERAPMTMRMYENQSAGKKKDGTGGVSGSKPLTLSGRMIASVHFEIEK